MGEIIVRKAESMNWKSKIALVLMFTLVFSMFMLQGWYQPAKADAAITTQQSWANVYHSATLPGATAASFAVSAGSKRMLVVALSYNFSASATQTATSVTYGGVAMTQAVGDAATSLSMHTYLYYLKDNAVMDGTAKTLAVNITGGTAVMNDVWYAVYAGVDQSATPLTDSQNYNNNATAATAAFGTALTVNAGDQAVLVAAFNTRANGGVPTYTTPASWTVNNNQPNDNATSDEVSFVASFTIPGSNTTNTASFTLINPNARVSMSGMSLSVAYDLVNVTDGTDPATYTVYRNNTNMVADAFTMAMDGNTGAVTGVTVSLSNSANVSSIRLYKDNGVVGTYEAGTDTLLATVASPTATVNFSGFTENLTTATSNYLILVDIAANATAGQTVVASVTGLTVTAPDSQGTVTDLGTTLNIGSQTLTAGNNSGMEPAPKTVYRGDTSKALDEFTLSVNVGSATVNTITVTGTDSGGNSSAEVSAVSIWQDTGTVPNEWDPGDTLVATTTFAFNTATFSGLSIPVTAGTTDTYIITVDVSPTATSGRTVTAQISGITSSAQTSTDSDTGGQTLNIGSQTLTAGNNSGTETLGTTSYRGKTNKDLDEFTLSVNVGSATVNTITVTGTDSGGNSSAEVSAVKIWKDTGSVPDAWDPDDTLVASTTFTTNTATFSGLSIPVTAGTTDKYIITADVSNTATAGRTVTARLTGITSSAQTNTPSDTTSSSLLIGSQTLTVGNNSGAEPALKTVYRNNTNKALDEFTLSVTASSVIVDTITVTGTATGGNSSTEASAVKIWQDTGSIPHEWDPDDTLVASTTFATNTAAFSGLSIPVTAGTTDTYIVTVDVAAGATAGRTVTARLTGITSSATTNTPSDTTGQTLTIGNQTLTAGNGTNPAPKTVYRAYTNQALDEFTLSVNADTTAVDTITVTGTDSGGNSSAEVSAVNIWLKDPASISHEWEPGDTLIASTTFATNTATFSGLSIPVTAGTTDRYIITVDVSNTATAGRTVTARVTGITSTAQTNTPSDTAGIILTIGVSQTLTAGNNSGQEPASRPVYVNDSNQAVDEFTLSVNAGTTTVNTITVTSTVAGLPAGGTGATETAAVTLWKDTGNTPHLWDPADTFVATTTFATNTATFSGLSIPVTSGTTDRYIITVDIPNTATPGRTVTAQLSGITSPAQTNTDSDTGGAILTIAAVTMSVTNLADYPAPASVQQGQTSVGMLKFQLSTNASSATWTGGKLDKIGTNAQLNAVTYDIYYDANDNGTFEPGTDTKILSSKAFSAATGDVYPLDLYQTITTTPKRFFIVYDVAVAATTSTTVGARIAADSTYFAITGGTVNAPAATSSTLSNIVAGVCTRSAPSVSLGTNKIVSPGGTVSYTVTIINNDSLVCIPSTFAIGNTDNPSVPNSNFATSSLGSASTGSLAPGGTYTTTLTHTAKAGAAVPSAEQTTVNVTEGTHATGSASISTVVFVNNSLLHNSPNMTAQGSPKNYWSNSGGWGITGGMYGEFTCSTCHAKSTTNIKRVKTTITVPDTSKGNILGSAVIFRSVTGTTDGFGDDQNTQSASTRICEVCHTLPAKHKFNQSGSTLHENTATTPANYQDCIQCHEHKKGFVTPGCIDCHSKQQGSRAPVVGQFSSNSHHVQGVTLSNTHCYQCHWEANANGSINYQYHAGWQNGAPGTPNADVDLVVWNAGARPVNYILGTTAVTYTANVGGRSEYSNINAHCLGCHSDTNLATQPFGDGKKTSQYAWDGNSVKARYSQSGTTTWGKYTTLPNAAQKNAVKAFSAHGRADLNTRGWNTTNGYDGAMVNTSGTVNVLCYDCHNSHGSSASGTTTSYASATTNGGILKDTTAGLGGYTMTYQPQDSDDTPSRVKSSAGGSLCFDCHMTANAGTTPWGYTGTFGASQAIIGYNEKPGWVGDATNPAGAQKRYAYKNNVVSAGGHFKASSPLGTTTMGTINGLCTPCHDPHGVSPTDVGTCSLSYYTKAACQTAGGTWTANATTQAYGVPMLKGTWMTSPYKEDAAPANKNEARGGGDSRSPYNVGSTPGYHIDQNTFPTTALPTSSPYTWNFASTAKMTEADAQFGGLCLGCHNKSQLNPNTTTTWKSYDRIHNTVKGWANGANSGANNNNAIHAYSCSKCHTPHNSCLPRLLVTNCLDFNHRGRVASGGTVNTGSNLYTNRGSGSKGTGNGGYPSGGGGDGSNPRGWNGSSGAYFFGIPGSSRNTPPALQTCHDNAPGNSGTWPTKDYWNTITPWP